MARTSGRVPWIAWPALLACAAVVVALVYLAAPALPGAVDFIGATLRNATTASAADDRGLPPEEAATDCRTLYPDRLWSELSWTATVQLTQDAAAPATATSLPSALGPAVRFTCTWQADGGRSIQSSVSQVAEGSAAVAQAALTADGFACEIDDEVTHCERTRDQVVEMHDLRGDLWLSSVLTAWLPEDYRSQTVSRAMPG